METEVDDSAPDVVQFVAGLLQEAGWSLRWGADSPDGFITYVPTDYGVFSLAFTGQDEVYGWMISSILTVPNTARAETAQLCNLINAADVIGT